MRIERYIINQFKAWKEAPDRKPILLKGARPSELKSVFQTSKALFEK